MGSYRRLTDPDDATFCIRPLAGLNVNDYIDHLARLRITVFREFPYLYDGTLEYERNYLRTYTSCPESLVVVVFDGNSVVGASTGIPLEFETDEFKRPFLEHGYDPGSIFYFGESVLLSEYRGRGIGVRFFEERERYARRLGRFEYTAFCAVERPDDHPRRPRDYVPLDAFWTRRGYAKRPEMRTTYSWRDLDEENESPKPMVFWMKSLKGISQ
jgi:GNAT superfamily N-acetyltransferase